MQQCSKGFLILRFVWASGAAEAGQFLSCLRQIHQASVDDVVAEMEVANTNTLGLSRSERNISLASAVVDSAVTAIDVDQNRSHGSFEQLIYVLSSPLSRRMDSSFPKARGVAEALFSTWGRNI